MLDDRHEVGQRLVRVVDVALHVEHRHPARLGDVADVLVAEPPVALADGDAVVVAAEDLADLLGGVAVGDLGGLGLSMNWACPPSWAMPASKEARVRVLEKKKSMARTLSRRYGVRLVEGAVPLQGEGDVEQRVELVLGPLLQGRSRPVPRRCVCMVRPTRSRRG